MDAELAHQLWAENPDAILAIALSKPPKLRELRAALLHCTPLAGLLGEPHA